MYFIREIDIIISKKPNFQLIGLLLSLYVFMICAAKYVECIEHTFITRLHSRLRNDKNYGLKRTLVSFNFKNLKCQFW